MRPDRRRWLAAAMVAAVAVYLVLLGLRGVDLVRDGRPAAVGLGLAVLVFPFLGAWLLWREVGFGLGTQDMARELERAGGLPLDELPRTASGRADRDAADAAFAARRAEVEAAPGDWGAWFRLALAYDDARDRRRARAAMRHALALYRKA